MRRVFGCLIAILFSCVGLTLQLREATAQGLLANLPRNETLILENPEGTVKNAGWFNIWAINAGSQSNGLQQAALDTLWYIDPNSGLDGVWQNSLAAEKPAYNGDFTEMTVKLRSGIYWSDGVEFTAADVVHTVTTQIKHKNMRWSAALGLNVEAVEAPDPYTVRFKLKKPNSRFHALFTVRWNAIWIMPKHVFEKVEDPLKFDFNKPVSLGAYVLHNYDPDGRWYIWQRREDWQRTTLGAYGKPGPKYLAYVDPGPPDKRVIAQMNHELDVIHDVAPEGMFTLAKQSKSSVSWFKGFPYAHPDPTLPALIFNTQNDLFKNKDVRWALALLIDIKAVSMASYRGAATISAIGVPPTGRHPEFYHAPMQEWLAGFELDTGKRKIKPYDANRRPANRRHAAAVHGRPDTKRSQDDRRVIRHGLVEGRSAGGYRTAREGGLQEIGQQLANARRQTVHGPRRRGRRNAASHDARRLHDRRAVAAVRHRCESRCRAGHARDAARRRRFRHHHDLERRDVGRTSGSVLLPGQLALAIRGTARHAAAGAQLAALVPSRSRQDHRGHPQGRLR